MEMRVHLLEVRLSKSILLRLKKKVHLLDVNVERAEDVLAHKRLLKLAEDPASRPAFQVRLVQVVKKT